MSRQFDTPIVSIYDLMVERHRKLISESESGDSAMGAQRVPRGKVEEETMTNSKIWSKKPRTTKAVRERPSLLTLESESYRPLNSITATHLTKKQTILKVPPPAKKEVIDKLVEKMSKVCGRAKAEVVVPQPSENSPKQVSGNHRKGKGSLGTSRGKQKPNKSNVDRRSLSPRKAERDPKEKRVERVSKEKTMLKSTPKLPKTSGDRMRSVRESSRSLKTAPLSNDRWRI